jgi:muramoyltetrapeptide carboxypeptidase LdcA involved in peptidoglycan recycling
MPASAPVPSRTRAGFLRPRALGPGSTVALVSPSDPAAHLFPERVERASLALRRVGMHLRVSEACRAILDGRPYLAGSDEVRARDLQEAFADPAVDAVWASIGGMNSNRLLDRLDFGAIARQPKVLLGYSDLTCLLNAVHTTAGLVTFHGPNLVVEWGGAAPDPFTAAALWRVVGRDEAAGALATADRCRLEPWPPGAPVPVPATTVRGNVAGVAEGSLVGGNLQTLIRLAGTPWWPSFEGRVLFWEDVGLPEHALDALLTHLRLLGVFEAAAAVVVGKVVAPDERSLYPPERMIALTEEAAGRRLPIVAGFDIGHTDPMLTLPLGVWARVDSGDASVRLLEGAVEQPVDAAR